MLTLSSVLQGLQVLVVDNNVDNCDLLRFTLELYQMQVRTAQTVSQAMIALMQTQPDILITDIVLPQEDGYTLLNKVRRLEPGRGGKALAIAITADITQTELQAIAAGFAKFLLKPIDVTALVAVLTELIGKEEGVLCSC